MNNFENTIKVYLDKRAGEDREREYDREICVMCGGLRVMEKIVSVELKKIVYAGKTEIPSTALETQGPGE